MADGLADRQDLVSVVCAHARRDRVGDDESLWELFSDSLARIEFVLDVEAAVGRELPEEFGDRCAPSAICCVPWPSDGRGYRTVRAAGPGGDREPCRSTWQRPSGRAVTYGVIAALCDQFGFVASHLAAR